MFLYSCMEGRRRRRRCNVCNRCGRRPPACRTGLTKCCGTRLLLFHCKCPFFLSFVWPLVYSSNNSYKWVSLPPSLDTRNNAPSAQAVLLILTAMPLQVTLCNTHTHTYKITRRPFSFLASSFQKARRAQVENPSSALPY